MCLLLWERVRVENEDFGYLMDAQPVPRCGAAERLWCDRASSNHGSLLYTFRSGTEQFSSDTDAEAVARWLAGPGTRPPWDSAL
jgi:hypothetical protein